MDANAWVSNKKFRKNITEKWVFSRVRPKDRDYISLMNIVDDLLFKDECYYIIGLCMKIHSSLGKGFTEIVYKDALEVEIKKNQVPYEREKIFRIIYENSVLPHFFKADYVVFESIVLEIKAALENVSQQF